MSGLHDDLAQIMVMMIQIGSLWKSQFYLLPTQSFLLVEMKKPSEHSVPLNPKVEQ